MAKAAFVLSEPALQVNFAHRLAALKRTHLQPALLETIANLDIAKLDKQLSSLAPAAALQKLASIGLRGESLFVTPIVLLARPSLLTYYRTLLGYSQKEFYKSGSGLAAFKKAEDAGLLGPIAQMQMSAFCTYLNQRATYLLKGLASLSIDQQLFSDLSLLSIGPQLRGGSNNMKGDVGIEDVFKIILSMVSHANPKVLVKSATFFNATKRKIDIALGSDPDVTIYETTASKVRKPLLAIEVKAGTDASNVHNRIGEAEKSHLQAKASGFTECWTIVNVANFDALKAKQQSPTTHRFFRLAELMDSSSDAYREFEESLISKVAISSGKPKARRSKK